jgi:hypothetical protein
MTLEQALTDHDKMIWGCSIQAGEKYHLAADELYSFGRHLVITNALAGNCIFTVTDPDQHRVTIKIATVEQQRIDEIKKVTFVSVLNGPDNTRNYAYLGLLEFGPASPSLGITPFIRTTAKSKRMPAHKPVAEWVLWHIFNGKDLPEGYEIRNAGRCFRCGRLLTVPSSIDSNYGPECIQKTAIMRGGI